MGNELKMVTEMASDRDDCDEVIKKDERVNYE
jgi:hypothetical protein